MSNEAKGPFKELTDEQWNEIEILIIATNGRIRRDREKERNAINGVLYQNHTLCAWHRIPKKYGSHNTCYARRHRDWSGELWTKIYRIYRAKRVTVPMATTGQRPFRNLTDAQWEKIQPLLPPAAPTGRPRADDRQTINGVLYVLHKQCQWRDLPTKYGSHTTCWRRYNELWPPDLWDKIQEIHRS